VKLIAIGSCEACGLELHAEDKSVRPSMDITCPCGARAVIRPSPDALARAGRPPSTSQGPSARKGVKAVGVFLLLLIMGTLSAVVPAYGEHGATYAATVYITVLLQICKIGSLVTAVVMLLAFLYWAYRLSADGQSALVAFGLPLVTFGFTVVPLVVALKDYMFVYSNTFLYFLLGVTGATLGFSIFIIMYVSTDAMILRVGRIFAVLPYILVTTLWLTALGDATVVYALSAVHPLWAKAVVCPGNLLFALMLLAIPAGASFFISD